MIWTWHGIVIDLRENNSIPWDTSWHLSSQSSMLQERRSCLRRFPLRSYLSLRDKLQSSGDPFWPLTYSPGESIGALKNSTCRISRGRLGKFFLGKWIFCFVLTHSNNMRSIHSPVTGSYGLSWTPCIQPTSFFVETWYVPFRCYWTVQYRFMMFFVIWERDSKRGPALSLVAIPQNFRRWTDVGQGRHNRGQAQTVSA
jgi:hypothetical protein